MVDHVWRAELDPCRVAPRVARGGSGGSTLAKEVVADVKGRPVGRRGLGPIAPTVGGEAKANEGACEVAIQKGARVLISLWDSLMFGRVPKNAAPFLGTRPDISESHSEISTRVPFCIGARRSEAIGMMAFSYTVTTVARLLGNLNVRDINFRNNLDVLRAPGLSSLLLCQGFGVRIYITLALSCNCTGALAATARALVCSGLHTH